ncbi:MAG TPA: Gfo/Idh/MocA family oxidoreductase [Pyrinomonadaceae bacterium]|jgi:predicted dehydrogenase
MDKSIILDLENGNNLISKAKSYGIASAVSLSDALLTNAHDERTPTHRPTLPAESFVDTTDGEMLVQEASPQALNIRRLSVQTVGRLNHDGAHPFDGERRAAHPVLSVANEIRGAILSKRETVGIGIIGAGFARTTQIPGFRACEGARVAAIASRTRANAEKVAREFDIPSVEEDWRELVRREDVDLVSIVTPPSTHAEMTFAALDAGKAVLCEKPMALDASETARMRDHARAAGLLAHIDHELRFLPVRQRMREMLAGGDIGRVRHAKFTFRADSRADAKRAWDWWSSAEAGGGVLGAIGSHAVDSLRWFIGAEVSEVCGSLATHVKQRPDRESGEMRAVTTDDEANFLLRFADSELTEDVTAAVSLSVVEPGRSVHRVEIFGSHGALRVEESGELFHAKVGAGEWSPVEAERGDLAQGLRDSSWSRGFTIFARRIVAALREGRTRVEDAATFDDGHHIQLVLDAARRSNETRCSVKL